MGLSSLWKKKFFKIYSELQKGKNNNLAAPLPLGDDAVGRSTNINAALMADSSLVVGKLMLVEPSDYSWNIMWWFSWVVEACIWWILSIVGLYGGGGFPL